MFGEEVIKPVSGPRLGLDPAKRCDPSDIIMQFEITESTREAVAAWIKEAGLRSEDYLFPSRLHKSLHLSTRQYAHIVNSWVEEIGLDPADYGTHSMRRTKGIPTLSMREHAAICGCRQPSLRNSSKHVPRSQGYSGNTIPRLIVRCPRPMATASHTSRKAHDVLWAPDPGHCEARNAGLPKIYQKGITDGQRAEQEHGRGRGGTHDVDLILDDRVERLAQ